MLLEPEENYEMIMIPVKELNSLKSRADALADVLDRLINVADDYGLPATQWRFAETALKEYRG